MPLAGRSRVSLCRSVARGRPLRPHGRLCRQPCRAPPPARHGRRRPILITPPRPYLHPFHPKRRHTPKPTPHQTHRHRPTRTPTPKQTGKPKPIMPQGLRMTRSAKNAPNVRPARWGALWCIPMAMLRPPRGAAMRISISCAPGMSTYLIRI